MGAEVNPPVAKLSADLAPTLRRYYELVGAVRWGPFGSSIGLIGPFGGLHGGDNDKSEGDGHDSLEDMLYEEIDPDFDPSEVFVLGVMDGDGDVVVYTKDERVSRFDYNEGQIHFLGTIEETIDRVFSDLSANRTPKLGDKQA